MGYIYLITCMITLLAYVGQTVADVEKRWKDHRNNAILVSRYNAGDPDITLDMLKKRGIANIILYKAMAKYGIDNFKFEIIKEVEDNKLNDAETFYIEQHKTLLPSGYNMTTGGGSGIRYSDEAKRHISEGKLINIDEKRNEKLRGMPSHMTYGIHKKLGEFICFQRNPICGSRYFYISAYGNFEKAKHAAMEFYNEALRTGKKEPPKKKGGNGLKKGIVEKNAGYIVLKHHNKKKQLRWFTDPKNTKEENLRLAEECLEQMIKKFAEEDKKAQELEKSKTT